MKLFPTEVHFVRCLTCQKEWPADCPEAHCKHINRYAGRTGFLTFLLDGFGTVVEALAAGGVMAFFFIIVFFGAVGIIAKNPTPILNPANTAFCREFLGLDK